MTKQTKKPNRPIKNTFKILNELIKTAKQNNKIIPGGSAISVFAPMVSHFQPPPSQEALKDLSGKFLDLLWAVWLQHRF